MSPWPAAQILGHLARYLGLPEAEAHNEYALASPTRRTRIASAAHLLDGL